MKDLDRGNPKNLERLVQELGKVQRMWPDMRLGQIIANAVPEGRKGPDLFDIEDKDLCDAIDMWVRCVCSMSAL